MTQASTKERLACTLEKAGAPLIMVNAARSGRYDDFESESVTPIVDLVNDLRAFGLHDLAHRAMNGEFDGTKEEAEAWYQREGRNLIS
jgi:hypothetical protein